MTSKKLLNMTSKSYPWICHLLSHQLCETKWRSTLPWRHTALCPILNPLQAMTSPVSGPFPVLLQLSNGQTVPVTIPDSITSSSVHIPTAIPLVRPVTVVPNVPGIPGPPSPQPVQSEAKLKLKAALSQQLPQVTNGDAGGDVQSSVDVTHTAGPAPAPSPSPGPSPSPAPPPAPPEDPPGPRSLQQPATSTTETPAPPRPPPAPLQHTPPAPPSGGGRRRRATSDDPDEKRRKFLERNRAAATRCRQKRKVWVQQLEKKSEDLNAMNGQLQNEVSLLRSEVAQLKQLLLAHKDCPVTAMQKKSAYHTSEKEDSCEDMSVPGSPQTEAIQHSSVSTSNGVSSSSSSATPADPAPAGAATSDQSTEEARPPGGAAPSQPSGS